MKAIIVCKLFFKFSYMFTHTYKKSFDGSNNTAKVYYIVIYKNYLNTYLT